MFCLMLASQAWAKSKDIDTSENEVDKEGQDEGGYKRTVQDPCYDMDCGIGHECDIDDDNKPVCICARQCTPEVVDRAKVNVCSTSNVTFDSECEMYRQKCMCGKTGRKGCDNREYAEVELDYFGPCKELGDCEEFEMEEYPRRMREWLYLIMEELDNRDELPKKASKMAKKALTMEKKWVIPVVWKFCDLDTDPDEEINVHELIPISAPLKPMEHCTAKFLGACDEDLNGKRDGKISKWEWGRCLGLDTKEMDVLCEEFKDDE